MTKITEEAVQQAAATARRRQVIDQQAGIPVESQAEEPEEAPAQEESRPEEQMPAETVFNIDDLLRFDGQENGGRA